MHRTKGENIAPHGILATKLQKSFFLLSILMRALFWIKVGLKSMFHILTAVKSGSKIFPPSVWREGLLLKNLVNAVTDELESNLVPIANVVPALLAELWFPPPQEEI